MESGLHARPAGVLAKAASQCKCNVRINIGTRIIDCKSIINLMVAAMKCGTEFELVCSGDGEEESLEMLTALIESGLGE